MADIFEILDGTTDPNFYMTVDEQATYIDVFCDGYTIKVFKAETGENWIQLFNAANDDEWAVARLHIRSGTADYEARYDSAKTAELIENTPSRVVIRVVTQLYTSTLTLLSNLQVIAVVYIYSNRLFVDYEFIVTTSSVSIDDYIGSYGYLRFAETGLANILAYKESSGVEVLAPHGTRFDGDDYLVTTTNEINIQTFIPYANDGTGELFQRSRYQSPAIYWNNGSLAVGTHKISIGVIFDSAERQYGSKKYTSVERLEMGDQYKDQSLFS